MYRFLREDCKEGKIETFTKDFKSQDEALEYYDYNADEEVKKNYGVFEISESSYFREVFYNKGDYENNHILLTLTEIK